MPEDFSLSSTDTIKRSPALNAPSSQSASPKRTESWFSRPDIGIVRQQARVALGDMEHNRPCLEQGEIAFLIGRNLAERMKRPMRGFLHRTERNKANLVGLAHFFKRPANARITYQSLAAIR